MTERPWRLSDAVAPGVRALRAQWAPILVVQVLAIALVFAYYRSEAMQSVAHTLSVWKKEGGLVAAFVAGYFAGGCLPEVAKALAGRLRKLDRAWLGKAAFTGFVYGIIGIEVDVFYRLQAVIFGDGTDLGTLAIKTGVDMALFATLIAIPTTVFLFDWRRAGFSLRALSRELRAVWYRDRVLPALIPNWAFWTPVLFCVYAMPTDLQFVFAVVMEAAWSLVFVFIATEDETTA